MIKEKSKHTGHRIIAPQVNNTGVMRSYKMPAKRRLIAINTMIKDRSKHTGLMSDTESEHRRLIYNTQVPGSIRCQHIEG